MQSPSSPSPYRDVGKKCGEDRGTPTASSRSGPREFVIAAPSSLGNRVSDIRGELAARAHWLRPAEIAVRTDEAALDIAQGNEVDPAIVAGHGVVDVVADELDAVRGTAAVVLDDEDHVPERCSCGPEHERANRWSPIPRMCVPDRADGCPMFDGRGVPAVGESVGTAGETVAHASPARAHTDVRHRSADRGRG